MTHYITWDHSDCEHFPNPGEHWCSPRGSIECTDPAGDCRKRCRVDGYSNCEDGWSPCINDCVYNDHPDPGVEHCIDGHILDIDECNVVLYIEQDAIANGPGHNPFTDGPIEVKWAGDGYQWCYLDLDPRNAVG